MATDKYDLLGPALAKIGNEVMSIVDGEPNGVFLYVEIAEGWVRPSLFRDAGNGVHYIDWDDESELCNFLFDAWYLEEADKRWSAMHYTIDGGKFDATFDCDDLERSEESIEDRRDRILHARYGDKPIIYPPWEGGLRLQPNQ